MALPELDTRSILDVVEDNFKAVNLKAYAIRMIYIGEHCMPKEDFITEFRKTIDDVNSSYCDVHVTGLLLVYDSYFVHVIEGSEDTVHRQMRFLFTQEVKWIEHMRKCDTAITEGLQAAVEEPKPPVERKMLKKLKVLMVYHSITNMLFNGWRAVTARPPSLVGKLDVNAPLNEHMEQLRVCLNKIRKLCELARTEEHLSFEGLSANDPKMEGLPEVALLDFLIQSQHTMDLRQVLHLHRRVDDYVFYFESVWPLPTHYTPRQLYKLKVDDSFVEPLPVMPWELKKMEEVEEEHSQGSGSSSSD